MTAARIPAAEWLAAKNAQTVGERAKLDRWLRVPVEHDAAFHASLPFCRIDTDDGPRVAAVFPPPRPFEGEPFPPDDADVVLVDIKTGAASLHRDRGAALLRDTAAETVLFTDGTAWLRAYARTRLLWVERFRASQRDYLIRLTEPIHAGCPGALLIGAAEKVRWPTSVTFTCPDDATAKAVQSAIYRAAHLSRAVVATAEQRLAA